MKIIKNNISIYQEGNSTQRIIIFVHGFPYDHSMWENQVRELSAGYKCVTYDIRGLGESPAGDGQFTMESFIDDLEFITDSVKPVKPVLCGLSMGGYISLRAVERFENKFDALILCDTKASADNNQGKLVRAANISKINRLGVQAFVDEFIPNCFAPESIEKLGDKYTNILKKSSSYDPVGVKGCLLAMLGRGDTSAYLKEIKIPVLILCGEKDKLTSVDSMKAMADEIKDSRFKVIPDAGHMTPIENPAAVNKAIKDFLAEIFFL